MTSTLKKIARRASRSAAQALSHKQALERIAAKGVEISTFIDVGAAQGAWSQLAESYWPDANFHLIEAKEYWRNDLEKLCERKPGYSCSIKAVSDEER